MAAATASPKTLLGDTAVQLMQSVSVQAEPNVRSSLSPQRGDSCDVNAPAISPRVWATTIRSSPEFARRMQDLGLAHTENEQPRYQLQQQDDQRVIADASAEESTTAQLHTTVADLRTTVMGLEDEQLPKEEEERRMRVLAQTVRTQAATVLILEAYMLVELI